MIVLAGLRQPDMSASAYGPTWKLSADVDVLVSVEPGPVTRVVIEGAVTWVALYPPGKIAERSRMTGCEDRFTSRTSGPALVVSPSPRSAGAPVVPSAGRADEAGAAGDNYPFHYSRIPSWPRALSRHARDKDGLAWLTAIPGRVRLTISPARIWAATVSNPAKWQTRLAPIRGSFHVIGTYTARPAQWCGPMVWHGDVAR